MARYTPESIRNIAILGHSHDGKTTLAEAMLLAAGAIPRMGSTEAGTSTLDFEPEEQKNSISIGAGIGHMDWSGTKINLVDCPGLAAFVGEAVGARRAVEGRGEPRLVVVNKLDKENSDFLTTLAALQHLQLKPVPLHLPVGNEAGFKGVVDLLHRRCYIYDGPGQAHEEDIPADMAADVETHRTRLVEAACMADATLLEHYLEGLEIADEEIVRATHEGIRSGSVVPVLCASATPGVGARQALAATNEPRPS